MSKRCIKRTLNSITRVSRNISQLHFAALLFFPLHVCVSHHFVIPKVERMKVGMLRWSRGSEPALDLSFHRSAMTLYRLCTPASPGPTFIRNQQNAKAGDTKDMHDYIYTYHVYPIIQKKRVVAPLPLCKPPYYTYSKYSGWHIEFFYNWMVNMYGYRLSFTIY